MKYLVMLFCLLFAGSVFADNAYFEGYVKLTVDKQEMGAKVQYMVKDGKDLFFELTITPDGEDEEPIVISGLGKETDDEKILAIYSADGKQRIGTGTAKGDDAFTLEFAMLYKDRKVGDVKIDKKFGEDGDVPGVYLNFNFTGMMGMSFEDTLPLDMVKTMDCGVPWADDIPYC